MTALYIVIGIVAFIAIATIGLLIIIYIAYKKAFFTAKKHENIRKIPKQYQMYKEQMLELIDEMDALLCENITITSFDRLKLRGRYYHICDDAPIQIQFHGYKGTAIRDFCGGNKLARELGFNTLVVDQRAHGMSEGKTISFGINERFDCLYWVNYVMKRFPDKPIYLAGVSMGAATVLMAAPLLPSAVKGIIADCPYSSPKDIICKVCVTDMKLPRFSYKIIKLGAKIFGKFDLEQSSATDAVSNATVPILIIHGENDKFVPVEMSKEIAAENKRINLVTIPEAGHGISYIVDPTRYKESVISFIASTSE